MENKVVCVISVHPDDETLGCGGTILRHITKGDSVYCVFVTGGNSGQSKLIDTVSGIYGFTKVFELKFPELELENIPLNDIIPKVSSVFNEICPNILYIPNRSDVHSDHRQAFNAVLACTKTFRYPSVEKVLMMEVISETDFALALPESGFVPNYFVNITNEFEKKLHILGLYGQELLPYPQSRNISAMTALNRYRGSQCGCEYAESFMLIKSIER